MVVGRRAWACGEAGVTKYVRGCRQCAEDRGGERDSYRRAKRRVGRQTASGTPNPNRQRTGNDITKKIWELGVGESRSALGTSRCSSFYSAHVDAC